MVIVSQKLLLINAAYYCLLFYLVYLYQFTRETVSEKFFTTNSNHSNCLNHFLEGCVVNITIYLMLLIFLKQLDNYCIHKVYSYYH